jgi:hypothetical protein
MINLSGGSYILYNSKKDKAPKGAIPRYSPPWGRGPWQCKPMGWLRVLEAITWMIYLLGAGLAGGLAERSNRRIYIIKSL